MKTFEIGTCKFPITRYESYALIEKRYNKFQLDLEVVEHVGNSEYSNCDIGDISVSGLNGKFVS